ncbi:hypothetical protein AAFN46_20410 [Pseudomonas sp. CAU 1711]|uniref:hypothetical protein n=1 Tax=Pseudomonas sp. CAU 1711 TaxID=3140356 RepID=UPI0032602800
MSRIEPTRLHQILTSLASPKGEVKAERNSSGEARAGRARRDISVLRRTLKARLKKLRTDTGEFESAAPVILVQEILCWEFGSEIAEHDAFEKATMAISDALQNTPEAQGSLKRLIAKLCEEGS